jgi:signal transduction histidine kinase
MHDGFKGGPDDVDHGVTGPWTEKLEESLAKIERGVAHLRSAGMATHPGLSQVAAGAAKLRSLVAKATEIAQARSRAVTLIAVDVERVAAQAIDAAKAASGFTGLVSIGKLGPLIADRELILLALRELVSNAIRFSNGIEGARVDVEMFAGGGETVVVVRDNGIGFDAAAADRLFMPYTTLHPGSPRAGAGLGLVLVRLAAARHGGRAWARSMPGAGTEFFISFPA